MVLKRAVAVAASLALIPCSWAQRSKIGGLYKYEVSNPSCPVRIKTSKGGAWQSFDAAEVLPVGTIVVGKPSKKSSDIVVFKTRKVPKAILAARKSCLFKDEGEDATEVSLVQKRRWMTGLSTLAWHEDLTYRLNGDTVLKTPMRANNLGLCLGGALLYQKQDYEHGISGCFVYAKAQIANANPIQYGDGEYQAKNVDVYGFQGAYAWYYRPTDGGVAVGGQIPLMVRLGRYPLPASTGDQLNVGPRVWFLTGLMLESRLERGHYYFSQKVGFYNIRFVKTVVPVPRGFVWGLEGGYLF